jgi:hypothetical protein
MKTLLALAAILFAIVPAAHASAQGRLWFDVPQVAAARDVTGREFALAHPSERLVEIRLPISMLAQGDAAGDVHEVVHRLESASTAAQVHDYWPKTQLATTLVGATAIEHKRQQDAQLNFEAGGSYLGLAKAVASGDYRWHGEENSAFQKLPSLELLTSAGTIDRGRGVMFKLKASPRTTLEGAYDYGVILRVPYWWRAGFLNVSSEAAQDDSQTRLARGRFVIALHQQGDTAAERAARNYAQAEADFRRAAVAAKSDIERRMYPTLMHKLGVTRDGALAKDWREQILFRDPPDDLFSKLPGEVRASATTLRNARRELNALNKPM